MENQERSENNPTADAAVASGLVLAAAVVSDSDAVTDSCSVTKKSTKDVTAVVKSSAVDNIVTTEQPNDLNKSQESPIVTKITHKPNMDESGHAPQGNTATTATTSKHLPLGKLAALRSPLSLFYLDTFKNRCV